MLLIDSPVGPFSPREEIEAWIEELKAMEPVPEVLDEIERAEGYLEPLSSAPVSTINSTGS